MICSLFEKKRKESALFGALILGSVIGVVCGVLLHFSECPEIEAPFLITIWAIFTFFIIIWGMQDEDTRSGYIKTIKTRKACIIGCLFSYSAMINLFYISKINPFGGWTLVAVIFFGEILFFLDRSKKPKDTTRFKFAGIKKVESTLESDIIILNILGISYVANRIPWARVVKTIFQGISNFWTAYGIDILRGFGYIAFIAIIFIGIVAWIWINSFRYKEKKVKKDKGIK